MNCKKKVNERDEDPETFTSSKSNICQRENVNV